jgi:hypothetical protein
MIMLLGSLLSAYEQGTYFIYDLVDQIDDLTVDKRLAVERSLFIESDEPQADATLPEVERSEFEIDYQTLGTAESSTFESTVIIDDEVPQANNETSVFNIGTEESTSLFGD